MSLFVPEWVDVTARELNVKRVLGALDDDHIVRRPMRSDANEPPRSLAFAAPRGGVSAASERPGAADAPALFVEHAAKGWLALDIETARFADLDASQQLFDSPLRLALDARLERLSSLGLPALVLLWSCSIEEARALSREFLGKHGVRLVSKDQFMQLGAKLVAGLLAPMALGVEQHLRMTWFPESEIPAACLPRRFYQRDNRATLVRTFLDPQQEWASKLDIELPAEHAELAKDFSVRLVNGVAGSGKTLIAMRRALLLCELFPHQRVLLLIHNTPIVADLTSRWTRALGKLPPNLEVTTFFAWTRRQWRRVFGKSPQMPESPHHVPNLIAELRQRWPTLSPSDAQLLDEFDFIHESLVRDEAGYLEAGRAGRGFALRPRERRMVWALYEAVVERLTQRGLRMWSGLPKDLCLAEPQRLRANLEHTRHVLIDEAQFFAPSWFQLVKQAMEPGGHLFVCADPNQGFMRNRLSWKTVGLDVAGRTKKLHRSYRTTRAILSAAGNLLVAAESGAVVHRATDRIDESDDYLVPDYAGMDDGARPMLIACASQRDAVERLANELLALTRDGGMPRHSLLVIYGDDTPKRALYDRLSRDFGAVNVWWFNEKEQKKAPPRGHAHDHLRMAYVDSATGLEAEVVFLIGVDGLLRRCFTARDAGAPGDATARKLYMAMTRAAQRLVVLASQQLPLPIERLFERQHSVIHQDAAGPIEA
jgi:hypothetical protein